MFARDGFKESDLSQIVLFTNDKEEIKGLLSFEDEPNLWFLIYENDLDLKKQMVNYLIEHHPTDDVIVPKDPDIIKLLEHNNYEQMDWIDPIAKFTKTSVDLPKVEDYEIKSLAEDYRLDQIHYALWKGFNHGNDVSYSEANLNDREHMTSSPHFKKSYTFLAHKDNHYVSYAGIWYLKGSKTALIEPVATIPEERRKGLSKACIYHAIHKAMEEGAKDIFVGSTQKFYYDIGFIPYHEAIRFQKRPQSVDD